MFHNSTLKYESFPLKFNFISDFEIFYLTILQLYSMHRADVKKNFTHSFAAKQFNEKSM